MAGHYQGEASSPDFHLMNVGFCIPHPKAERKIFNQFIAVEPLQKSAAKQLGYKQLGSKFFFEGRMCVHQKEAVYLIVDILSRYNYIFVRDLSILRQLTLMPWSDDREATELKATFMASLSAEGKFVQSLAILTRRMFKLSWKQLIPERNIRSDQMAARVYSCLSLIIGNAGPGQMQLPVYAARVLLSSFLTKWSLNGALVYLLLEVRAIALADRRQLARLLKSKPDSPQEEPALTTADVANEDTAGMSVDAVCDQVIDKEDGETTPSTGHLPTVKNIEQAAEKGTTDADSSSSEAGPSTSHNINNERCGRKNKITSPPATVRSEPSFPVTATSSDLLVDDGPSTMISAQPSPGMIGEVVVNSDTNGASALPPPPGGDEHQIDGAIIDEIVEEFLMADKNYREEKLSAERMSGPAASIEGRSERATAKRDGRQRATNLEAVSIRSVDRLDYSVGEAKQPIVRVKRVVVEPDDLTRMTCLLYPPTPAARPPFQVLGTAPLGTCFNIFF